MEKQAKIYIAGHNGLVGSALVRKLKRLGYINLLIKSREELDLLDQKSVADFFAEEKPEYVFLAAAKVGGILANRDFPADFIFQNLQIQNNVIHQSYRNDVKKLLFLGSSCIYPKNCPQPIKEEYLLTGELEPTNEPYAIAKIAGIKMCQSYNRQYGTNFISVMPTNLYGPHDNFDLNNSHVLPAMIRKFHEAKIKGCASVTLWGTGTPRREFLHVDDMADGCVFVMENFNASKGQAGHGEIFLNLGTGNDVAISQLAELVRETVGFMGEIKWDATKPDGTARKLLAVSRIRELGWNDTVTLKEGIKNTYDWFIENAKSING